MVHKRTVLFIRHGMTLPNKYKQYIGWLDPPLIESEKDRLSHVRLDYKPELVFTSDLFRAKETASIYFSEVNTIYSSFFRELHFGAFEGKTYKQLKDDPSYCFWIDHMNEGRPPEGEYIGDFRRRVTTGWEMIKDCGSEEVAVVTHGGWMREWSFLYASSFIPEASIWNIPFGGGWLVTFRVQGGEWECMSLQEVPITERKNG